MKFTKAHGAGNDFILLPDLPGRQALTPALAAALCRPHVGLGADGVIRLAPPSPGVDADVFMDYRNADGSVAEMCGNGVRCVAKYLVDRGIVAPTVVRVETGSGIRVVECRLDAAGKVVEARVDMGEPLPLKVDLALDVSGFGTIHLTTLSMGNPHAVIVVDDIDSAPVVTLGPLLQQDEEFPEGTNVEFIQVTDRTHLLGRIWERGVGETLASGSGASAMAAAGHLCGVVDRQVTVSLPGGALTADWGEEGLAISGPAVEVASGELDPAWLEAVVAS